MVIFIAHESNLLEHSDVVIEQYNDTNCLLEYYDDSKSFYEEDLIPIIPTGHSEIGNTFDRIHLPLDQTNIEMEDLFRFAGNHKNYFIFVIDSSTPQE